MLHHEHRGGAGSKIHAGQHRKARDRRRHGELQQQPSERLEAVPDSLGRRGRMTCRMWPMEPNLEAVFEMAIAAQIHW